MPPGETYGTAQEGFWAGQFGDEYVTRNTGTSLLSSKTALFSSIFRSCGSVASLMEYGANVGLTLRACKALLPDLEVSAVEINASAFRELSQIEFVDARRGSVLAFEPERTWEMVLVSGVLIHMAPDKLADVYRLLHHSATRFIVLCEYYNPTPVEVTYRGHTERLFKRDFPGELMDMFPDLSLLDYGFVYHRDPAFPMDDVTWFVLQKR